MAERGTFMGEVSRGLRWLRGLSWWWKGPIIGFAALVAIVLIGNIADGGGDAGSDSQVTGGTPTPTIETTAAPTGTSTRAPTTAPTPTESSSEQQPSGDGLALKVVVYDDTMNRPLNSAEVWLRGFGSWYPDVSFGSDFVTYEMLVAEGLPNMFVYPDGRDGGAEIPVTFEIPTDFIPGSDRHTLQIGISDTTVTVFGTIIPGLELTFTR